MMMKKLRIIICLCLYSAYTYAQETEVSTIIPSSAPAFTILGLSPTEISKPNSWNALQAAAYQSLISNNGASGLLKNFALEFKPYWLSNHPKFTYKNYLDADGFSLRNLSLSVASGKAAYSRDSAQSVGFGFRLPILLNRKKRAVSAANLNAFILKTKGQTSDWQAAFIGYVVNFDKPTVKELNDDIWANLKTPPPRNSMWKDYDTQIIKMMGDTLQQVLKAAAGHSYASEVTHITSVLSDYFSGINATYTKAVTDSISAALKEASNWEISGALSLAFPSNQFNYSRYSNLGIWSDYSFNIVQKSRIDGTAALRYIRRFGTAIDGVANNFDGIFRVNYATSDKERFLLSVWGVVRRITGSEAIAVAGSSTSGWDNKYGMDLTFKVSNQIAVAYSLGKNYKNEQLLNVKGSNQLISLLNLFYSINTKIRKTGNDYSFKTF